VRAWIVVDLGFGDAGKGLVTDALVRRTGAKLVVRYNGGAQAGHNVVTATAHHNSRFPPSASPRRRASSRRGTRR
jgi:adenylosuccinate synthase